jgi:uncharacterized protein YkwD
MFAACQSRCAAVVAGVVLGFGGLASAAVAKPAHRHHGRRRVVRVHAGRAAAAKTTKTTATTATTTATATSTATTLSATEFCSYADTPVSSATAAEMTGAVDCLINQQRELHGLPALAVNADLNSSAQSWSDEMVASNDFTHGTQLAQRVSATGYDWQEAGENIATGYLTPRDAVAAWMASPDHCQNVLDPDYRDMGTGMNTNPVASAASGPATWTQDFGLQATQNPLSQNQAPANGCPYTIPSTPTS